MFLHLSVSHSIHRGVATPQGRHSHGQTPPLGRHPLADTPLGRHPLADTPLGRHPLGRHPPFPVHAGKRSTSGRYASHWNAFFLWIKSFAVSRTQCKGWFTAKTKAKEIKAKPTNIKGKLSLSLLLSLGMNRPLRVIILSNNYRHYFSSNCHQ